MRRESSSPAVHLAAVAVRMQVANKAVVNIQVDPVLLARRLEKEVQRLKQELQIHNSLLGRPHIVRL